MSATRFESLTPAERAVARLALGRTNDQIGSELGISPKTVANHIDSAKRKAGCAAKGDLARGFQAWEASREKVPRQILPIFPADPAGQERQADSNPASATDLNSAKQDELVTTPAGADRVEDTRTPFVFVEPMVAAPKPDMAAGQYRPLDKVLLILVIATLVVALIQFVPGMGVPAQHVANVIDPLLKRAGVVRSR